MRQLSRSPEEIPDSDRFLVAAMGQAIRDESVRPVMAGALVELRAFMAGEIARAQGEGQVRGDVDPAQVAAGLAGLIDGLMLHLYIQPDLDVVAATTAIADLLAPTGRPDPSDPDHPEAPPPRRST